MDFLSFTVCVNGTILDYRKMSCEAGGLPSAEVASDNLPPVNFTQGKKCVKMKLISCRVALLVTLAFHP